MRQAITTVYLGPTNTRGGRVKATCYAGSLTHFWDYEVDAPTNHERAAKKLLKKLGWDLANKIHAGETVQGYVFVLEAK